MLFLFESAEARRRKLAERLGNGEGASEQDYWRILELAPDDSFALCGLGRLKQESGDLDAAEQYFWRAIDAGPCLWLPYLSLSQLLSVKQAGDSLADGVGELALRRLLCDEGTVEDIASKPIAPGLDRIPGIGELTAAGKIELIAEALRERRHVEPAEVTERLRPYRLVGELLEQDCPDRRLIDALVGAGKPIVPLLVGVLRCWARNFLPDEDEGAVENTLAILGEIGDASVIPQLLEFIVRDQVELSRAAGWVFDPILELHPDEAARVIGEIAPSLGGPERCAVTERILRRRKLEDKRALLVRLGENPARITRRDCEYFLPLLLYAIMTTHGSGGPEAARQMLKQYAKLLSRDIRKVCEKLVDDLSALPVPAPPPPEPLRWTVHDICAGDVLWEEKGEEEEEEEPEGDEEEFLAPAPVARKPAPGRNDPCWCGSGKKYKKCCQEADQQVERGDSPAGRGEFAALRRRLGDFLQGAVSRADTREAMREFCGGDPQEDDYPVLADWMMHDWIPPRFGRTVMDEYRRRHGSGLTPREREMLETWSRSYVGLYEVQKVRPGSGIEVKDLFSGEVFFVHDVSASKRLVRWDGLLGRVVPGERGTELTGTGVLVPREYLEALRIWMTENRRSSGLPWPEYLKGNLPRIRRRSSELSAEWISSVRLANSDGEELLISKAVYRVLSPETLIAALKACPEIAEDEKRARYTWLGGRRDEEGCTVLGSIRVTGGELTLECNSRQRHERGKTLLSVLAGPALQHLRDEFTTQQELKRRMGEEPLPARSPSREIPAGAPQELVAGMMARHFARWPDLALPALDEMTPRQAAMTAAGRRRLSVLLRDLENAEEHKRKAGEPYYDISRLRAELGVEEE